MYHMPPRLHMPPARLALLGGARGRRGVVWEQRWVILATVE
jgi:hypothetical protein